jgi:hypothetical protein
MHQEGRDDREGVPQGLAHERTEVLRLLMADSDKKRPKVTEYVTEKKKKIF